MADSTIRFRSRRAQLSSGSGASHRNSLCATGSDDGFGSSMGTSRAPRFLRSFIKAALIAIRVSQVANWDLPSKSLRWTKAFRKHSCAASSASSRLRTIRRVTRETCFIWRSQSSPKGGLRPLLAAAINCSSLHARRSLNAAASLCAERNVLITAVNLLPQIAAAGSWLPHLFPFPSTRGRTPDSSPASSHPPRNLLETSLRLDLPASLLVGPKH